MNGQTPELEFFGNIVGEAFSGYFYQQSKPIAAAVMHVPNGFLSAPSAPQKKAGRPKNTVQDITLLAHETLVKKCNPDRRITVAEARMAALAVIQKSETFDTKKYQNEARTIQTRLKRAREAIKGMAVCTIASTSERHGVWMALENPPMKKSGKIIIDSNGWYCASGEIAEWKRIQWALPKRSSAAEKAK